MELINVVKVRLATLRESGWDNLFFDVQEFCVAKGIWVPNVGTKGVSQNHLLSFDNNKELKIINWIC